MAGVASNGTLTPPPASQSASAIAHTNDTSVLKRKRADDDDDAPIINGAAPASGSVQVCRDALDFLRGHDPIPSFLDYAVDDIRSALPKKARLDIEGDYSTIAAKLGSGLYPSLRALSDDVARVSTAMIAELRAQAAAAKPSATDLKAIQRVKAFESLVHDLVDREVEYAATRSHSTKYAQPNGYHDIRGQPVLTLFGNAPTPKQLFSSIPYGPTKLPVEEMSLPTGLSATHILPAPVDETKKNPTIEDSFAKPYNLPSLNPPKSHKRASTALTWEFKDPFPRTSKKVGYTVRGLTSGEWLGYGGVGESENAASLQEKRKQRDRALSSSDGPKTRPSGTSFGETLAKEEDALFRRAYSSFLPSHDNAKSLVPERTKSALWWNKLGEEKSGEASSLDPALMHVPKQGIAAVSDARHHDGRDLGRAGCDDQDLSRVVEEAVKLDQVKQEEATPQTQSKVDVENVLKQVSALLETLASYQRIRSAILPSSASASRAPISPGSTLSSKIRKPDTPSDDEMATYDALRQELTSLVLKLPPYLLAKVGGDRLGELQVSRLVPFEGNDIKGVMEEDLVSRAAKYNAMATAAGIATLTRGSSSTSSQHYSSTNQRTPAIGQAAQTRYGSSAQYATGRTPSTAPSYQRSTSNQSQYGTPTAAASRQSYGLQLSQYTRPSQPSYSQANGHQYYQQRPQQQTSSTYVAYGQQYSQAGQTQQNKQRVQQYPSTNSNHQQQRPQASHQQTSTPQASAQNQPNRIASPAKVGEYGQAPIQPQQPRPTYPSQQPISRTGTPSHPSNPHTPVNGTLAPRPPPQPVAPALPRGASSTPQPQIQPQPQPQAQTQSGQTMEKS